MTTNICQIPIIRPETVETKIKEVHCGNGYLGYYMNIFKRKPFICRGLDIGKCVEQWQDIDEFVAKAGGDRLISVHVATDAKMNFVTKNFKYQNMRFDQLVKRAFHNGQHDNYYFSPDEKYYLRALADEDVRKNVADFEKDFNGISQDLKIPNWFGPDQLFSSVLRLSSADVQMWTHYDVMDNVLIQVIGRKRVCLFAPNEALNMYLCGDKSEIINVDSPDLSKYPKFANVIQHSGVMEPGDCLYIPALWFHTTTAVTPSISINAFWKNLNNNLYDQKDVYGNKDLIPASRAMQGLEKAIKTLSELPSEYVDFYARRMIQTLRQRCCTD